MHILVLESYSPGQVNNLAATKLHDLLLVIGVQLSGFKYARITRNVGESETRVGRITLGRHA
jgi:hypothetical protein